MDKTKSIKFWSLKDKEERWDESFCGFDKTWGWLCGEKKAENKNFCEYHSGLTCNSCGGPISSYCSFAGQFVCGGKQCDKCGCNFQSH